MSFIRSLGSFYRRKQQLHVVNRGGGGVHLMSGDHRGFAGMDRWRFEDKGRSITTGTEMHSEIDMEKSSEQHKPPPRSPFATWAKWILGSMLTLVIPMGEKKWRSLLRLGGEMEMVADAAEEVANAVEKVADAVEQVSSEVAERLPEDSKLKGAVLLAEQVSKEAAQDARIANDIIHKVDEVRQDVELLLESVVDGGKGKGSPTK